jgi:group I intron endonuclease
MAPEKRWQNGGGYRNNPHFAAAIQRHGWDNFRHEIIAEGLNQEEAERLEVELIAKYKSADKAHGYNISLGGNTGPKHSAETRAKIGAANRSRIWTPEARAKVGAASRGRAQSVETRQKRSQANQGRSHNEEAREKIREAKQKPVICIDTGERYRSIEEAAKAIGAGPSLVSGVCRGVRKTTRGLRFRFVREEVVA